MVDEPGTSGSDPGNPHLDLQSGLGGGKVHDGNNEIFFSAASGWEMAIKAGLGRLVLPEPLEEFIVGNLRANAFQILPVHLNHTCRVRSLPDHHRGPFDRLLVAQAQIEGFGLVSKDEVMSRYPVEVFW